jgi:hypothetical protein
MKDNTDMSEPWHSLYANSHYRGIHPDGHSCKPPFDVGIKLKVTSGMPKFWPIALLSVLNSKYKVRIEMEKERDRVSLISLSVGINLIGVETTDI